MRCKHDDSPVARFCRDTFAACVESRAERYSRRQFPDWRMQLLSRVDKAYTILPTQDSLACRASCFYFSSLASPHLESDHSPMELLPSPFGRPSPLPCAPVGPRASGIQRLRRRASGFASTPRTRPLWPATESYHGLATCCEACSAASCADACCHADPGCAHPPSAQPPSSHPGHLGGVRRCDVVP